MDGPLDDDACDPIVDGWMKILIDDQKTVWFERWYNEDVDGRKEENEAVAVPLGKRKRKGKGKEKGKEKEKEDECGSSVMNILEAGLKKLGKQMMRMNSEVTEKLGELDLKMNYVLKFVPPMDFSTGKEKVVVEESGADGGDGNGEDKEGTDKEVSETVVMEEEDKEVSETLVMEEEDKEETEGTELLEETVKVKAKKKRMKKTHSNLVKGPFTRPNTRSRVQR